jgi:hypothetical protein
MRLNITPYIYPSPNGFVHIILRKIVELCMTFGFYAKPTWSIQALASAHLRSNARAITIVI